MQRDNSIVRRADHSYHWKKNQIVSLTFVKYSTKEKDGSTLPDEYLGQDETPRHQSQTIF